MELRLYENELIALTKIEKCLKVFLNAPDFFDLLDADLVWRLVEVGLGNTFLFTNASFQWDYS